MTSKERRDARYQRRKEKRDAKKRVSMQEYDNFDKVFTFEHLWKCYKKCVCGVAWKTSTQKYRNKPITNIVQSYVQLKSGTYKSKGFYSFDIIERGKTRHIKSVHISERIVQRCLCDFSLIPVFTATLIYDNGACMKDKGIDFAKDRTNCHLQQYYRQHNSNDGYALVIDYSSFFDSILHEKLEVIIRNKYTDERIIALYMHFVSMFGAIGLGLGSQISQISAIRYPSENDNFIKHVMKIRYYARYMDDSYLISDSKEELKQCKAKIVEVCAEYGISLNKKKAQIVKLQRGLPFLKQRFILTGTGKVIRIPTKASAKRMRKKLKVFAGWLEVGKITQNDVQASYNSWKAHLQRSNAFRRLKNMDKLYNKIINNKGDKANGSS